MSVIDECHDALARVGTYDVHYAVDESGIHQLAPLELASLLVHPELQLSVHVQQGLFCFPEHLHQFVGRGLGQSNSLPGGLRVVLFVSQGFH